MILLKKSLTKRFSLIANSYEIDLHKNFLEHNLLVLFGTFLSLDNQHGMAENIQCLKHLILGLYLARRPKKDITWKFTLQTVMKHQIRVFPNRINWIWKWFMVTHMVKRKYIDFYVSWSNIVEDIQFFLQISKLGWNTIFS